MLSGNSSFLCDGKGAVRRAILYTDMSNWHTFSIQRAILGESTGSFCYQPDVGFRIGMGITP